MIKRKRDALRKKVHPKRAKAHSVDKHRATKMNILVSVEFIIHTNYKERKTYV